MGFDTRIVWISDLHLTESGTVDGAPCRDNLERLIAQINRDHGDAACCIASGDLTDTGSAAEYAALKEMLADLSLPFLPMIGNHDQRETLMSAFPPPGPALSGHMQYRWDTGDITLICLDTQDPGEDSGKLDEARLDWLQQTLADCTDRRVLVFAHHPPGALGLGPLDQMPLLDEAPLMDILAAAPQVDQLFCGHVHRSVTGTIRGVPVTTLRSVSHQTRSPYENWGWSDYIARQEAPQFGVILIGEDRVITQLLDLEEVA